MNIKDEGRGSLSGTEETVQGVLIPRFSAKISRDNIRSVIRRHEPIKVGFEAGTKRLKGTKKIVGDGRDGIKEAGNRTGRRKRGVKRREREKKETNSMLSSSTLTHIFCIPTVSFQHSKKKNKKKTKKTRTSSRFVST